MANSRVNLNFNKMNKQYLFLLIIIIIFIIYIIITYNSQAKCSECSDESEKISEKVRNIEEKINTIQQIPNQNQIMLNENFNNGIYSNDTYPVINRTTEDINSLDRIFNPIRYPYKSPDFYESNSFPAMKLPFQVMGCGGRNQPCLGGTQTAIYNPMVPINVSNSNIAPINIRTRGEYGAVQQVGLIYKINGDNNEYHPLMGRANYRGSSGYDYYTMINGVKIPIVTQKRNDELGNNDVVFIKGNKNPHRVTIYETDSPMYIPY